MSRGYTRFLVTKLLEGYALLEDGRMPGEDYVTGYIDWGTVISTGQKRQAHFEMAAILKADIDRAIRHLRMTPKFVIASHAIAGRGYEWCAYLLGLGSPDVIRIEGAAIERMVMYLNGEDKTRRVPE